MLEMAHTVAIVLGIVFLLIALGLLIWAFIRQHNSVIKSNLTTGLFIAGGVLALVGLFVLIAGIVEHPKAEAARTAAPAAKA